MSSFKRSLMAFRYSVRLRRRKVSVRPGFGFAAATSSRDVSNQATMAWRSSGEGDGTPTGGIVPVRSFRMTVSNTSDWALTLARSTVSSLKPAVSSCSLWQTTQYWLIASLVSEAEICTMRDREGSALVADSGEIGTAESCGPQAARLNASREGSIFGFGRFISLLSVFV